MARTPRVKVQVPHPTASLESTTPRVVDVVDFSGVLGTFTWRLSLNAVTKLKLGPRTADHDVQQWL